MEQTTRPDQVRWPFGLIAVGAFSAAFSVMASA
jgi:hypothetical protein